MEIGFFVIQLWGIKWLNLFVLDLKVSYVCFKIQIKHKQINLPRSPILAIKYSKYTNKSFNSTVADDKHG